MVRILLICIVFYTGASVFADTFVPGPDCFSPRFICIESGETLTASASFGDNDQMPLGCLSTTPNQMWVAFKANPNGLPLALEVGSFTGNDIDFALWGPLSDGLLTQLCLTNDALLADCSYSGASSEFISVPTTGPDSYFLLLITNFTGTPTDIYLTALGNSTGCPTGGPGVFDCLGFLGFLSGMEYSLCLEAGASLSLPDTVRYLFATPPTADYTERFLLIDADTVVDVLPDLSNLSLPTGAYTIYSYLFADSVAQQALPYPIGQAVTDLSAIFSNGNAPFCATIGGNPVQLTVQVTSDAEPVDLGTYTICEADTLQILGEDYFGPVDTAVYSALCDTLYSFAVQVVPLARNVIDTTLCPGDVLTVNGELYTTTGTYLLPLNIPGSTGCDSVLQLNVLPATDLSITLPDAYYIDCDSSDVVLEAQVTGADTYTVSWQRIDGDSSVTLPVQSLAVDVGIPGSYQITLDVAGASCVLTGQTTVTAYYGSEIPGIVGDVVPCVGDTVRYELSSTVLTIVDATAVGSGTFEIIEATPSYIDVYIGALATFELIVATEAALCQGSDPLSLSLAIEARGVDACSALITGGVWLDEDGNCSLSPADITRPGARVELQPSGVFAYTDIDGRYGFAVAPGDYEVRFVPQGTLQTACDADAFTPVSVAASDTVTRNFQIYLDTFLDLRLEGTVGIARPGQPHSIRLSASNLSAFAVDAAIEFQHDVAVAAGTLVDVADSYDAASRMAVFDLVQLQPGATREFTFQLQVLPDTPLGAVISQQATLKPVANDIHPADNTWIGQAVVVAAYDPNIKINMVGVDPFGGDVYRADSVFDYRVDFQNTGTDTAFWVTVRDTLDENFDAASVVPGLGSHPFQLRVEEARILIFDFPGIMLPDSAANQLGSRGYLTYRVKVDAEVDVGTEFRNSASIYFDNNPPVRTNTVINRIEKDPETSTLPKPDLSEPGVFPNPTDGTTTVRWPDSPGPVVYTVYDVTGRRLQRTTASGMRHTVALDALPAGIYWLAMQRNERRYVERVVRQ